MSPQRPIVIIKQLILAAAAAAAFANSGGAASGQQLPEQANGQATSGSGEWSPSGEDSWNYWWSYSGISGPAYWGLLNLDWHMCDKGRRQSPINIETNRLVYDPHLTPLQLDNNLISGVLHNDGHAIVFNVSAKRLKLLMHKQQPVASSSPNNDNDRQQFAAKTSSPATAVNNRSRRNLQDFSSDTGNTDDDDNSLLIRVDSPLGVADLARQNSSLPSDTRDLSQKVDLSISQSEALDGKESLRLSNQIASTLSGQVYSPASASRDVDAGYEAGGVGDDDEDSSTITTNGVQITGAGLSYGYRFEALYFRFGLDNRQAGSEHLIDSRWHSAEVQIFAYNSVLYKSFHEASSKPHGLVAISILVDAIEEQQQQQQQQQQTNKRTVANKQTNSQLEKLLRPLTDIKYRNQMVEVGDFNLSALLPETRQFVTYEGSLSIPGCHESVDWLILNRPLYIRQSSLDLLRSISADEQKSDQASGTLIAGNLRPVQPINNRPIRTSIRPSPRANNENPAACQRLWTRYDYRPGGFN